MIGNLLMGLFLTATPAKGNIKEHSAEEYMNKIHPPAKIGACVEKDKLGIFYDDQIKGFKPFISANVGRGQVEAGMKLGIPCPSGIHGDILANIGSENSSYNNTINSITDEDGIRTVENSISNQETSTNSSAFGLGLGKGKTKLEVILNMNNTNDETTENSQHTQTYGSSRINVGTEAKTDLKIGRNNIDAKFAFPIYSQPDFTADVDLYTNWSRMNTEGNTTISNQIDINGDVKTSHETAQINNKTERIIYTVEPTVEKESENTYWCAKLPTNFGKDYSAVEFSGEFCGYKDYLIGHVNGHFNESQASFGGKVFYSGNPDGYEDLVKKIKGGWEGASSILKTPEEGGIKGKFADNGYHKNLNGFGAGGNVNLEKGKMPEYGLNFILSKNNKFTNVSASTENPLDMKNNYKVSITGGSGVVVDVSYGKANDDDFWSAGLTL